MQKISLFFKNNIKEILIFFTYMFSFLLMEQIINKNIYAKLGENYVVPIYAVCILFTAIGYILFSVSKKIKIKERVFSAIIELVFILSMILNIVAKNGYLCIVLSMLSTLTFGYLGAKVHFILSQNLNGSNVAGKVIGISLTIALLLQIIIYNSISNVHLLLGVICLFSILLFILLINEKSTKKFEVIVKNKISKYDLIIPITVVALISIMIGLQDGVITDLDSKGYINVYGLPRITYIIGSIIAGIIADIKQRKYLTMAILCASVISIVGIVFLQTPELYKINVFTMFLLAGFYVMYLTVAFMDLAPNTNNPKLWAGMGRIIRSVITAIIVIPSDILFKAFGYRYMLISSAFFILGLIIIFYLEMNHNFKKKLEQTTIKEKEKNIKEFLNKYSFTKRESEICNLIFKDNKKTKDIADELDISERSVERHLTNIYDKTKVKSRNELYDLFYNV